MEYEQTFAYKANIFGFSRMLFKLKEVVLQISNYLLDYPQAKSFVFCFIFCSKAKLKDLVTMQISLKH